MENLIKLGVTVALQAPKGSPFPIVHPDIYKTVDWVSSEGFDSIELHLRAPDLVDGQRLKDYCDGKSLLISTIGTGMACPYEGLTLTSDDSDIRKRAIKRLREQIDLAKILNCDVIIGSMRGNILNLSNRRLYEEHFEEAMKELSDYAEKKNVNIVIEAIDRYEINYLLTAGETLELIEKVGSDYLLVHLDTFHMNMEETDWLTPILQCGKRLGHVHLADNNRNYPGWGHIDFVTIMDSLNQIGYDKSATIECFPIPDGYTAAQRGLQYIKSLTI